MRTPAEQGIPVFVFDETDEPVGSLIGWERDRSTGEPRSLKLQLTPEAAEILGTPDALTLPSKDVFSMRRDRLVLDHTFQTLGPLVERGVVFDDVS